MTERPLAPIINLPPDVLSHLALFLPVRDLLMFCLSCRSLSTILSDNKPNEWMWKQRCYDIYREIYYNNREFYENASITAKESKSEGEDSVVVDHVQEELESFANIKPSKGVKTWKEELKHLSTYIWDSSQLVDRSRLTFSNHNRTARNNSFEHKNWWETIRATKKLTPGKVYHWEIVIDEFTPVKENLWWMLMGVESSAFRWQEQDHWVDVISYDKHRGACMICGVGHKRYRGSHAPFIEFVKERPLSSPFMNMVEASLNKIFKLNDSLSDISRDSALACTERFKTGDVIGFKFDMTNSSVSNDIILEHLWTSSGRDAENYYRTIKRQQRTHCGASLEIYKNGKSMGVAFHGISGQLFYPTVSIVHQQSMEIRYWSGPSSV
ncbi:Set1/Ash2 histone methyltransferase complex subunit [Acrasis kona]|uniref:Set1/Ash2 histone methyltransferase complex subunit n=1 Tax=Acrasis kona TaxID=1008807 RepID=A0AAW2YYC2_9EUKA